MTSRELKLQHAMPARVRLTEAQNKVLHTIVLRYPEWVPHPAGRLRGGYSKVINELVRKGFVRLGSDGITAKATEAGRARMKPAHTI